MTSRTDLCLLGTFLVFGQEKADDDAELGWWCYRARRGGLTQR